MNRYFTYIIFTLLCLSLLTNVEAQKKLKSKKKGVVTKTIARKTKSNKQKKVKKSKSKIIKRRSTARYDENVSLNNQISTSVEQVKLPKTDSIPEKVVTIISSFKPQLKNIAKINFTNASLPIDTSSTSPLVYNVPSQNLSFQYKPISLVPRSYKLDSQFLAQKVYTLQVGYGNYFHHFLAGTVSIIDKNDNTHSLFINNESITGAHHLQSQKDNLVKYVGNYSLYNNNLIETQIYFKNSDRYRYGLVADSTHYPNSNFTQNYTDFGGRIAYLNNNSFKHKWIIKPSLLLNQFEGQARATNTYALFDAPIVAHINKEYQINLDVSYSYNQYSPSKIHQKNEILQFKPSLSLNKWASFILMGVSPVLENGKYAMYPEINFKRKLADTIYTLNAGWNTQLINNQYTSLVSANPWLQKPVEMLITKKDHKFIGFDIDYAKGIHYGFNLSLNEYKNLPLFTKLMGTNRQINGLQYKSIFETKASTIELDAYFKFQISNHFIFFNNTHYIQFNSLTDNDKPWGILPLEFNNSFSWKPNDKLTLEAAANYFSGAAFMGEQNVSFDAKNALVLSANVNYVLTPQVKAWIKGDNLLDKPYSRWAEYPSLGVQLIAGIVYSLHK